MKKFLGIICCVLVGLLAVSVIAFGQNESELKSTEKTTTSAAAITPLDSIRALQDILLTVIILVVAPIIVFALYNKYTLKAVLDANQQIEGDKRKPVTTLLKAMIQEPLGLPNGSVRAIIAIVGISIFAYAIFAFADYRKELISALISLLSAVIGFYFGARATEDVRGLEEPKKPEDEKK